MCCSLFQTTLRIISAVKIFNVYKSKIEDGRHLEKSKNGHENLIHLHSSPGHSKTDWNIAKFSDFKRFTVDDLTTSCKLS